MLDDADLEIGLRWDRHRNEFDVSLRFEIIGSNVDEWLPPGEPLHLDVGELEGLSGDEPAYGAALTRMLLRPADVKPLYLEARKATDGNERKLHMRLHISAPPRFHALRWESLRDPPTGTPIALRSNVLLSRYLSSADWRPIPALAEHDLRALIVVAGPRDHREYQPNGRTLAEVDVEEELARAQTALAGISDVRQLTGGAATLSSMLEALEQGVDILYLVCHGALIDDVPLLYLENPDRKADVVDGRRLVERLSELERRPTVVMLCSCQSASTGAEIWSADEGELSALGPRLAAVGVAAVVAMQGNISMETATTFAPAFFTALARHGIVDEAMAAGRRTIHDRRDWWVPVLFSRLRSGRTYYRPQFAERGEETWKTLELQIDQDNLTPVLGPGLASGMLGSRQEMACRWVERWQMPIAPHNQGDLAQVAQYLRVRSAAGVVRAQLQKQLMTEILERRKKAKPGDPVWNLPEELVKGPNPEPAILEVGRRLREIDEGDPYRVMAALPVRIYITTGWTDLLQKALEERERKPVTLAFPWNDVGNVEGLEVEPTVERPLVYHLYGRLDNLRSLVLSEDDYFAWLTAWIGRSKSVPPAVKAALTGQSLLFLGYRLDDWDFRVVFQSIKSFGGSSLLRDNLHVGVQLSPESQMIEPEAAQEYLESYFGEDKVTIYWGDTQQFLDEMRRRGLGR
jgi:CHAT domain/SIR2-like domain